MYTCCLVCWVNFLGFHSLVSMASGLYIVFFQWHYITRAHSNDVTAREWEMLFVCMCTHPPLLRYLLQDSYRQDGYWWGKTALAGKSPTLSHNIVNSLRAHIYMYIYIVCVHTSGTVHLMDTKDQFKCGIKLRSHQLQCSVPFFDIILAHNSAFCCSVHALLHTLQFLNSGTHKCM